MLVFKYIVLTSIVVGSYCMSSLCYSQREIHCSTYDNAFDSHRKELPKTVDDLRNFCSNLIPLTHCILGVYEKCAKNDLYHDSEEDVERFQKTVDFIESSCKEESHIFQVVSGNINCIRATIGIMDDACFSFHNDTLREKILHSVNDETACILDAWYVYCTSAKFDIECGNEVGNAVLQISFNTNTFMSECEEKGYGFSYLEDAFKSEFGDGKRGEDILPGIFEAIKKERD